MAQEVISQDGVFHVCDNKGPLEGPTESETECRDNMVKPCPLASDVAGLKLRYNLREPD